MEDGRFRKRQVKFYVTDDEYQTLKKKAKRNGMSVGKYIREMLIHASGRPVPTIDVAPLKSIDHELKKQGTNLNQFMKFLNTYGIKVFDAGEAQRVLAREVETFMEVAEALAALRREADRNNVHLKIEDFDNAEND